MRTPYKGNFNQKDKTRINDAIKARELRVIGAEGENLGVLSLAQARKAAETARLDLIEISPNAKPPVAKIMDFGQYRYETKRKASEVKAKSHVTETKSVQVKIGTSENDQNLKARRVAEWLNDGHRVKVDLFLWGRYKYMEESFLKERLDRFLKVIPAEYKMAEEVKKSPKGLSCVVERLGKSVKGPKIIEESKPIKKEEPKEAEEKTDEEVVKKKKRDIDDILGGIEGGLI